MLQHSFTGLLCTLKWKAGGKMGNINKNRKPKYYNATFTQEETKMNKIDFANFVFLIRKCKSMFEGFFYREIKY